MEYLKNSGSSFILFREKLVLFLNSCDTFLPQTSLSNSRRRWQSLSGPFSSLFICISLSFHLYFSFFSSIFLSLLICISFRLSSVFPFLHELHVYQMSQHKVLVNSMCWTWVAMGTFYLFWLLRILFLVLFWVVFLLFF